VEGDDGDLVTLPPPCPKQRRDRFDRLSPALDLDEEGEPATNEVEKLPQSRHRLPPEAWVEVCAGVERRDLGEGHRRDLAAPIGGAIDRRIVNDDELTIAREMHVALRNLSAALEGFAVRRERILRRVGAR